MNIITYVFLRLQKFSNSSDMSHFLMRPLRISRYILSFRFIYRINMLNLLLSFRLHSIVQGHFFNWQNHCHILLVRSCLHSLYDVYLPWKSGFVFCRWNCLAAIRKSFGPDQDISNRDYFLRMHPLFTLTLYNALVSLQYTIGINL